MYDSVFVLSSGRITSIGPQGEFNWQVRAGRGERERRRLGREKRGIEMKKEWKREDGRKETEGGKEGRGKRERE